MGTEGPCYTENKMLCVGCLKPTRGRERACERCKRTARKIDRSHLTGRTCERCGESTTSDRYAGRRYCRVCSDILRLEKGRYRAQKAYARRKGKVTSGEEAQEGTVDGVDA